MSEVRVQHHVFSSDGGYRTTYASPDLAPKTVEMLETTAAAEHTVFSAGPAHSCFRLGNEHLVVSRTFVHGADHVGRRRLCSHSIVLPNAVRRLEGFNAADPPLALFMSVDIPVERPGNHLVDCWDVVDGDALRERRERARQALGKGGVLVLVLSGLLAPSRTVVIGGALGPGFIALGLAGWLLPPEVRQKMTYRVGNWRPEQITNHGDLTAIVVPDVALLRTYRAGKYVTVDMTSTQAGQVPRDSYAGWLASMAASPRGAERFATLMSYLTAFPGPQRPSLDQLSCLVQAYRLMERTLLEPETAEAVALSTQRLIGAIVPLVKSGRPAMARWLVGQLEEAIPRLDRETLRMALGELRQEQAKSALSWGPELGRHLASYSQRLLKAAMDDAPSG